MSINWQKLWRTQQAMIIFPPLSTLQLKIFKIRRHQFFKFPKPFSMSTWPQFIKLSNRTLWGSHLSLKFLIKYVHNGYATSPSKKGYTCTPSTSTTSSIEIFLNLSSIYKLFNLNEPPLTTPPCCDVETFQKFLSQSHTPCRTMLWNFLWL